MAVRSIKLTAIRGDTNEWDFPYSDTPISAVFSVTNAATSEELFSKTLGAGISEIASGLHVELAQTDLINLPPVLTVLSYYLRVTTADVVETIAAGAIYIYAV